LWNDYERQHEELQLAMAARDQLRRSDFWETKVTIFESGTLQQGIWPAVTLSILTLVLYWRGETWQQLGLRRPHDWMRCIAAIVAFWTKYRSHP